MCQFKVVNLKLHWIMPRRSQDESLQQCIIVMSCESVFSTYFLFYGLDKIKDAQRRASTCMLVCKYSRNYYFITVHTKLPLLLNNMQLLS